MQNKFLLITHYSIFCSITLNQTSTFKETFKKNMLYNLHQ